MKPHSCRICQYHEQIRKGIEHTEDGDFVIHDHYCTLGNQRRKQTEAELEFGCGLFEERYR